MDYCENYAVGLANLNSAHRHINWLNNIDEAVMANANLIKELIDVRNGDKCVPILDMQDVADVSQWVR